MGKAESKAHAAQMRKLVREWRSSGKSQAAFCQERGLKAHTLSYWNTRMQKVGESVEFVSVDEASAPTRISVYEIALPNGSVIRLRDTFDPELVRRLAMALRRE